MLVTDLALARRLERAEATASAMWVESRARLTPERGATWREVGGAYAMFDGVGSPITQTFGLGAFEPATDAVLDALETFFAERGADCDHEVCPLGDASLLATLPARGYRPIEQSTVLWRSLHDVPSDAPAAGSPGAPVVRIAAADEADHWADVAARGWRDAAPDLEGMLREFGRVSAAARGTSAFLAEIDGEAVASGALFVHEGVAVLAGASTVAAFRRRGAQAALLAARLAYARGLGCDLAMMAAAPGSTSQTNAERQGFRIAYTRTKWRRPLAGW